MTNRTNEKQPTIKDQLDELEIICNLTKHTMKIEYDWLTSKWKIEIKSRFKDNVFEAKSNINGCLKLGLDYMSTCFTGGF